MITIIDYGSGNLKSIKNGFKKINANAIISSSLKDIDDAEALVLPGVGAFGNAMENLDKYENSIEDHIATGKPFLGVCLGLQVLFPPVKKIRTFQVLIFFREKFYTFQIR